MYIHVSHIDIDVDIYITVIYGSDNVRPLLTLMSVLVFCSVRKYMYHELRMYTITSTQ